VITTQVDAARESTAGVDLDEEMTNMIQYQQAYNAAARFITAIDEALDTLINGTGRVGR
jgi:flagellar hook-associated protein 1 FlgK